MNTYLAATVFDEALRRIRWIYDECDDVIVSMSGGKDSTVVFELVKIVARERGRLPVKVFWLDQEAEWIATGDYMRGVMYQAAEVVPFWFQIPFRLTNSLSFKDNYLYCWDAAARDKWIREQDPISIKENPLAPQDRFKHLINWLPAECAVAGRAHVGIIIGMRIEESLARRAAIGYAPAKYKGITWCRKAQGNTRCFYPIYDFAARDVWVAIARNGWVYNKIYDYMYRYGISSRAMRVSALIHETAWRSIEQIQEVEPQVYNRYLERVQGVNCFNHLGDDIAPTTLPTYFSSWREYRDYLLEHIIEPQYWPIFRRRWAKGGSGQNEGSDEWCRIQVKELLVNDVDGTINENGRGLQKVRMKKDIYKAAREQRLATFLGEEKAAEAANVLAAKAAIEEDSR